MAMPLSLSLSTLYYIYGYGLVVIEILWAARFPFAFPFVPKCASFSLKIHVIN
jgi:hypothetical protein